MLHEQPRRRLARCRLVTKERHDGQQLRIAETDAIDQLWTTAMGHLIGAGLQTFVTQIDVRDLHGSTASPPGILSSRNEAQGSWHHRRRRDPAVNPHPALRDATDVADDTVLVESGDVAVKRRVSPPAGQPRVAFPDVRDDGWRRAAQEASDLVVAVGETSRLHVGLRRLSYRRSSPAQKITGNGVRLNRLERHPSSPMLRLQGAEGDTRCHSSLNAMLSKNACARTTRPSTISQNQA